MSGNSSALHGLHRHDSVPTTPCGIDDLQENSLDVEWSGSVAKNAQIVLVACYPASSTTITSTIRRATSSTISLHTS